MGIGIQEHLMKRRNQSVVNALSVLAIGSAFISSCANPWAIKSFNSGLAKQEKGDYQGAISDYSMAIEIDSQYAGAYINRGNSKRALEIILGPFPTTTRH